MRNIVWAALVASVIAMAVANCGNGPANPPSPCAIGQQNNWGRCQSSGGTPQPTSTPTAIPTSTAPATHIPVWVINDSQHCCNNVSPGPIQQFTTYDEGHLPQNGSNAAVDCGTNTTCIYVQYQKPHEYQNGPDCQASSTVGQPYNWFYQAIAGSTPNPYSMTEANSVYHKTGGAASLATRIDKNINSPNAGCFSGGGNDLFAPQIGTTAVDNELQDIMNGAIPSTCGPRPGTCQDFNLAGERFDDNAGTSIASVTNSNYTTTLEGISDPALSSPTSQYDARRKVWLDFGTHALEIGNVPQPGGGGAAWKVWLNQLSENPSGNVAPRVTDMVCGPDGSANTYGLQLENGWQVGGNNPLAPKRYVFVLNTMSVALYTVGCGPPHVKVHNVQGYALGNSQASSVAGSFLNELITYTAGTWLHYRDDCSNAGCTVSDFQIGCSASPCAPPAGVGCSVGPNTDDCNAASTYPIDFIVPTVPLDSMSAMTVAASTTYGNSGCGKTDKTSDHGSVDIVVGGLQTAYPVAATSGCGYSTAGTSKRSGVYARRFNHCWQNQSGVMVDLGACVAVLNSTIEDSSGSPRAGWQIPCATTIGQTAMNFNVYGHRLVIAANHGGPMAIATESPGATPDPAHYTIAASTSDVDISSQTFTCNDPSTGVIPSGQGWLLFV